MIVACPRCGSSLHVALSHPESMKCRACGFDGAPPEDVVARARAAFATIAASDVAARQLRASQARALVSASGVVSAFVAVFALAIVPVTIFGLYGLWEIAIYEGEVGHMLVICVVPMVVTIATGVFMLRRLLARRRALETACAAVAPLGSGAPCRCHLCGGDLPATPLARAVVRCTFCAADNLVDPRIIARAASERGRVLTSQGEGVEAELSSFRRASAALGAGTVALTAVLPPLVAIGVFIVILPALVVFGTSLDESARYVVMPRKDGDCIGYAQKRRDGNLSIAFLKSSPGEPRRVELEVTAAPPLRDAKSFVGERLRRPSGEVAVVKSVKGNAVSHNVAVFDPSRPDGTDALQELCFPPK